MRVPLAYAFTVASRVVSRIKERRYRIKERRYRDAVIRDSATVIENTCVPDRGVVAVELADVLAQLPPLWAQIVVLRKAVGMSDVEIAAELGISCHTVKRYLRLALARARVQK